MLKRSLRFTGLGLYYVSRLAVVMAIMLIILGTAAVITLRYWVLPDIEHYHQQIVLSASHAIGQPVEIGHIEADWGGLNPRLSFTDTRIFDKTGKVALSLSHVENFVSWMTLFSGQLRLASLEIEAPDLSIRRDAQGLLYVAGIALSPQDSSGGLSDWLLHQSSIVVRNGRISWQDELRQTPVLTLNAVDLRIENSFSHHRFAVRAIPPRVLAAEIDVRGDFRGKSFAELSGWRGEVYTQLDYADVGAWKTWLPLPRAFRQGKGAVRSWLGIEQGRIKQLTADLSLRGVQTRWTEELPALDLQTLHGRVSWNELERGFEVSTQNLAMRLGNGYALKPTDFYLRLLRGQDEQISAGEIRINAAELGSLGNLVGYLPLDESIKKRYAEFAPRGRIAGLLLSWQGEPAQLSRYEVRGRFDELGVNRVGELPGFSGLSGKVDGHDSGGSLSLNTHRLKLDAPTILAEPLLFDTLTAQVDWQHHANGWGVKLNNVAIKNEDMEGTVYGTYQSDPQGPGVADVTVNLNHVSVRNASRYIPLHALNDHTYAWLQKGLLGGEAEQFRLRVHGDLRDFPFPENRGGVFKIEAKAKDVGIEFLKEWPRIEHANADLSIEGRKLEVKAATAVTAGANVQKVIVTLPDMMSNAAKLQIRGEAVGETAGHLAYIRNSPVRGYLGGLTDDAVSSGSGRLNLFLDIPLQDTALIKVQGSYHFDHNDIALNKYLPALRGLDGDLAFTEAAINAHGQARILGGPATITASTSSTGAIGVSMSGRANMDALHKENSPPLAAYFYGSTDWRANIAVQGNRVNVAVNSNLLGLESALPAPFDKRANEAIPVSFAMQSAAPKQEDFLLNYGKLLNTHLQRNKETDGVWRIKRGSIGFGEDAKPLNRDGIWIAGTIPHLSVEGWGGVGLDNASENEDSSAQNEIPDIAGISLNVQTLDGFGVALNGLHVGGFNRSGMFTAQLTAKDSKGELIWQDRDQNRERGKLTVRLRNLTLDAAPDAPDRSTVRAPLAKTKPAKRSLTIPDADIVVERLTYKGKQLGKLDLLVTQSEGDAYLKYLHLINPDGSLSADGRWEIAAARTTANLKLTIADAGRILARSGYPDSVQGGSGTLESKLVWHGSPADFNYATLDGSIRLNSGKGRFLKVNLGAGKLLSVLSLQALPKRVSLDFTDVFSEGFQFESITGDVQIVHGMMLTNDFKLNGSAANVTMQGQVDLNAETQNLHVTVLPNIGDSVSIFAFAGGPVVGASVLLANKLLRDPLDKLVSFEYNVTGGWADPQVEKVGQAKPVKIAPPAGE